MYEAALPNLVLRLLAGKSHWLLFVIKADAVLLSLLINFILCFILGLFLFCA